MYINIYTIAFAEERVAVISTTAATATAMSKILNILINFCRINQNRNNAIVLHTNINNTVSPRFLTHAHKFKNFANKRKSIGKNLCC